PMAMYLTDLCTIPANLAGNTSLSVPCGTDPEDGLPVGFQIMAPALADDRTYRVGAAVERALTERDGALPARRPYAVAGAHPVRPLGPRGETSPMTRSWPEGTFLPARTASCVGPTPNPFVLPTVPALSLPPSGHTRGCGQEKARPC